MIIKAKEVELEINEFIEDFSQIALGSNKFLRCEVMFICFIIGIAFASLGIVVSAITGQWVRILNIWGTIGIIFVIMGVIISGTLNSGDRIRLDYVNVPEEEKNRKRNWTLKTFLIGFPSVAVTLLYYYFGNN